MKGQQWWYSETPLCVQLKPQYTFNRDVSTANNWMDGKDIDYDFIVEVVLKNLKPTTYGGTDTTGTVHLGFYSHMAPLGVKRIRELVDSNFFDTTKIFRK